jgi:hypothetical protein
MGTRTVVAALTGALALAMTGAGTAPASKHRDGCHPRAAKTAARTAKVRVFWVRHRLYACVTGQRRPYLVAEPPDPCPGSSSVGCDDVAAIRVAGRFVAVVGRFSGSDHASAYVEVLDVAHRTSVADWSTPNEHYNGIADLELSPRGALGLIAETVDPYAEPGETVTYEVRVLTSERSAVLDSGPDIAPRSLALARNDTLYWTNAGAPRSAFLR